MERGRVHSAPEGILIMWHFDNRTVPHMQTELPGPKAQERRRGARSGAQAGPLAHRPIARHRFPWRLPWPDLRGHVAVRLEAGPPSRLLAAGPRYPSRAVSARLQLLFDVGLCLRQAD